VYNTNTVEQNSWRGLKLKTARASLKGKIAFTVTGVNLKNVELKVSSADQEIAVKLSAESLLVLLDRLRFATETVILQLIDLNI